MREIHKNINVCSNSAENSAEKSAGNWQISLIISLLLLLPGKDKLSQVLGRKGGERAIFAKGSFSNRSIQKKLQFVARARFRLKKHKSATLQKRTLARAGGATGRASA